MMRPSSKRMQEKQNQSNRMIEDTATFYHHCWHGTPQNASSCLLHESTVLEQVWLCQAKHPMLVPDGVKECDSFNGKGRIEKMCIQVLIGFLEEGWKQQPFPDATTTALRQ